MDDLFLPSKLRLFKPGRPHSFLRTYGEAVDFVQSFDHARVGGKWFTLQISLMDAGESRDRTQLRAVYKALLNALRDDGFEVSEQFLKRGLSCRG